MSDAEFLHELADTMIGPDSPAKRLREIAGRLAQDDASTIEFLHKRRGELVIERDRYKAALGQLPEGRDVMLAALLAQHETDTKRIAELERAAPSAQRSLQQDDPDLYGDCLGCSQPSTCERKNLCAIHNRQHHAAQPPSATAEQLQVLLPCPSCGRMAACSPPSAPAEHALMRSGYRCEDGRLMRHDPMADDPNLETDVGRCPVCESAHAEDKP